jgi:hypothetical protein
VILVLIFIINFLNWRGKLWQNLLRIIVNFLYSELPVPRQSLNSWKMKMFQLSTNSTQHGENNSMNREWYLFLKLITCLSNLLLRTQHFLLSTIFCPTIPTHARLPATQLQHHRRAHRKFDYAGWSQHTYAPGSHAPFHR